MDPDLTQELEEQIRELNATLAQLSGTISNQVGVTSSAASSVQKSTDANNANRQATSQNSQAQNKLNEANKNASDIMAKASQNFGDALNHSMNALNSFSAALFSSQDGMAKYGKAAESLGEGALSIGRNFGILGTAIGGAFAIFGKIVGEVFKLNDNIINTRDSFTKAAGVLPTTTTELGNLAKQARFSLDDMQKLSKATNSLGQNLLGLGGYAGQGAVKFMKMANVSDDVRRQYGRLGVSQEQLLDLQAKYVQMQGVSGQAMQNQSKTADQLRRESLAYADNLIKMSSLTGKAADELQAERDAAMLEYEEQVQIMAENKKIADLRAQGRTQEADAIQLEQDNRKKLIQTYTDLYGKEQGQLAGRLMRQGAYDEKTAGIAARDPNMLAFTQDLKTSKNAMGDITKQADRTKQSVGEAAVRYGKALQYTGVETGNKLGLQGDLVTSANKLSGQSITDTLAKVTKEMDKKKQAGTDPLADSIEGVRSFEREMKAKLQSFLEKVDPMRNGFETIKKAAIAAAIALGAVAAAYAIPAAARGIKSILPSRGPKAPPAPKQPGRLARLFGRGAKTAAVTPSQLLDKRGQPLRGAALQSRMTKLTGAGTAATSGGGGASGSLGKVNAAANAPGANKTGGFLMSIVKGLEAAGKAGLRLVQGAGYLSAAIAIIGAGIAAATWLMGAALPNLAKGLKSFDKLNGPNLKSVGLGMAGLGAGILAMGAGQVAGAVGNVVNWFVKGEDPLENATKQIKKLEGMTLNTPKIKNNSEAVVAFSKAMMAASAMGAAGAGANMAKGIADSINGFFGGKPVTDQLVEFSKLEIDSKNVKKNAKSFKIFAEAMASYKGYGSNSGAAGAAIADATTGFFKQTPPYEKMAEFGKIEVNSKKVKKNASAFKAFAEAMASFKGYGSSLGAIGSAIAESTAKFFGVSPPLDQFLYFSFLPINAKRTKTNATSFRLFSEAMAAYKGLGSPVGAISTAIADATFKFFGVKPPLQQFVYFSSLNIDPKKTKANADAFVSFANAMANYKGGPGLLDTISSLLGKGFGAIFGEDGPVEAFRKFAKEDFGPKASENSANFKKYAESVGALGGGNSSSSDSGSGSTSSGSNTGGGIMSSAGNAVGNAISTAGNAISTAGSAVGSAANSAYQGIGNFAKGVYDTVTGNDPPTGGTISAQGKTAKVSKNSAPRFQNLLDYMTKKGYKIRSLGGFVDRDVRGRPGVKSAHGRGWAIDINPAENPLQEGSGPVKTDMSPDIIQYARAQGLGWGGAWRSRRDAMHFSTQKNEGGTFKAEKGGVFSGPRSGYQIEMHGSEMVAPLDMNSVLMKLAKTPANAPTTSATTTKTMSSNQATKSGGAVDEQAALNLELYGMITRKIDNMISVLENSQDTQSKMLRHARA